MELDILVDDELIESIQSLAGRHYGDDSKDSQRRVLEAALQMRLLSLDLVERGGSEVDEPLVNWEFANKQPAEQPSTGICD